MELAGERYWELVVRVLCLIAAVRRRLRRAATAKQPVKLHVPVPMRDGVRLYANVFLPVRTRARARHPGAHSLRQRRGIVAQLPGAAWSTGSR